jgi:Fe-S-cluster-containing hydrogenase component 2
MCPTGAIVQQQGAWRIDDSRCVRCNACAELAPDDVVVEDRFLDAIPLREIAPADVARAGGAAITV